MRDAVFGNVGTTVVFRVGPFDAEVLETIFMPRFTKEDVVGLDRRQVYLSLMIDGVGSQPFSAVTIPPIEAPPVSYREQVITESRKQFTSLRAGVEKVIIEELAVSTKPPSVSQSKDAKPAGGEQTVWPSTRSGVRGDPRTFARRSTDERPPRPPIVTKTADDLKSILRNMTAKTGIEKEKKQSEHQQSLKGTLSEVLKKSEQKTAPTSEVGVPTVSVGKEKNPFEVSEDKLREVLKGDI